MSDTRSKATEAALAAARLTTEYGVPVTVSFDYDEGWLVVTDAEGASEIVARDVDGWYGSQIASRLAAISGYRLVPVGKMERLRGALDALVVATWHVEGIGMQRRDAEKALRATLTEDETGGSL